MGSHKIFNMALFVTLRYLSGGFACQKTNQRVREEAYSFVNVGL